MPIPRRFCWTRFGTEAGQDIGQILERKEQERVANSGIFLWGIGNGIGPSLRELLKCTESPEVLFSPVRSSPRREDSNPIAIAVWTSAETLGGHPFKLPDTSLVTSRHNPGASRQSHYALVCFCEATLAISRSCERIALSRLRNLLSGRPVGPSQVTAVVECSDCEGGPHPYDVAIRATLVYPYLLRLQEPLLLSSTAQDVDWASTVRQVWLSRLAGEGLITKGAQDSLFPVPRGRSNSGLQSKTAD